ncbi:MAG: type 2 isopentenyl-diphosphate Delta-isomerase [Candidatus Hadarchaeales archaeon]
MSTKSRKEEHLRICMNEDVEGLLKTSGFEDIELLHRALPEMDLKDVDVSTRFLGFDLKAPVMILPMTGGHPASLKINRMLASVAEEMGLVFAVGSLRSAFENSSMVKTYQVRDVAPHVFLVANIGLQQLTKGGPQLAVKAVEMIDADALSIHLNTLQEAVQLEGEPAYSRGLSTISTICRGVDFPVIVKETGAGISGAIAIEIEKAGASAIDVSGAGGTSWSAVEFYRKRSPICLTFWDWGIPTAVCTAEVSRRVKIPVISSGGIRSGIDAAKAIALGASLVGLALPVLRASKRGERAVKRYLQRFIQELRVAMFLTGARKLEELRKGKIIVMGRTREWLEALGVRWGKG